MRYEIPDATARKIAKKINSEFRHNRLALFDEMSVVQIRSHIKKLYKKCFSVIKSEFLKVLLPFAQEIYDEALALGYDGDLRDFDEAWIEEFFDEYNPVTKYVFSNELERKESRLFESLVANEKVRHQSYITAEKLLIKQIEQYAIELADAITKVVHADLGVRKVKWIAEDDYKTCSVCNELDDQIFDIEDAPPKQHYNCRCYLIPIRETK